MDTLKLLQKLPGRYEALYLRGLSDYPLVEKTSSGAERKYVYGPTGLLAVIENGSAYYLFKDHLKSTRAAMNGSTGAGVEYNAYNAWGELMTSQTSPDVRYKYTGQEYDAQTGIYNYRARMYDEQLGRFYAIDPAGAGFSPYSYAANNPVSFTDPSGSVPKWYSAYLEAVEDAKHQAEMEAQAAAWAREQQMRADYYGFSGFIGATYIHYGLANGDEVLREFGHTFYDAIYVEHIRTITFEWRDVTLQVSGQKAFATAAAISWSAMLNALDKDPDLEAFSRMLIAPSLAGPGGGDGGRGSNYYFNLGASGAIVAGWSFNAGIVYNSGDKTPYFYSSTGNVIGKGFSIGLEGGYMTGSIEDFKATNYNFSLSYQYVSAGPIFDTYGNYSGLNVGIGLGGAGATRTESGSTSTYSINQWLHDIFIRPFEPFLYPISW
ncbi:MAG: RHS repeat-associated core domain-containing protein [Bacteroidetes bacterium]|nr:MAG: RHS repeat-associated core domain-containing protein [Bacteroidota bacterium]